MSDAVLHVGIEHPDALWLLGAGLVGFGLGYLNRLLTADSDDAVAPQSETAEATETGEAPESDA